jgi:predicted metal-dependent HD superfamily phosphohydrolase
MLAKGQWQWQEMWKELRAANPVSRLHGELVACYREPHRKYHTLQHLEECFSKFEEVRALARHPAEIELALWFHDAIYNVKRRDNEKKSADWARTSALAAGTPEAACDRVHALIMTTRHKAVPHGTDAELLVDVDLSILGAAPDRFDQYERQVREEYAWVPDFLYRRERRAILKDFLAHPRIFSSTHFRSRYEQQARANIKRSIEQLGAWRRRRN